jgi:hypothetical protein
MMLKRFLRLFALVAGAGFAAAAVVPITASAAGGGFGGGSGITVVVGSPITLTDRLLVDVPVTITCTGTFPTGFGYGEVDAQVQQASGKSVATGFGHVILTSCPTTPQTFIVPVTPQSTAPGVAPIPFHGGPALAWAGASAGDAYYYYFLGGSVGPIAVRL